jgi:arsenate reductase-like glutaredoxin family protein
LRFFSERRVAVTFVDLARKPIAPGELRRFAQRFGASELIDKDSGRYRDLGFAYLSMAEDEAFEKALADQRLLKLPLARAGDRLSVGVDENAWREWLRE